jgi:hypothetical protein
MFKQPCICPPFTLLRALPVQDQLTCSACVGFVFTAAAEAAVNVHMLQSWDKLSLSEQDISFCK